MAVKVLVNSGPSFTITGCMDPLALNYDPLANDSCSICCIYEAQITGCMDPLALNYDSNATVNCCCSYNTVPNTTSSNINLTNTVIGPTFLGTINTTTVISASTTIRLCQAATCIDCTNFDWWNDTYISAHNGQSLQLTSPILWQQIVDLVTNSGQTFYATTSNGEPLDERCCATANGTFKNGICFCDKPSQEVSEPSCISNLNDFLSLISTTEGYTFFTNNFSTIGPSLDLTTQQTNFILANINNSGDTNSNGISDLTEARLILSNALNLTGGFYVNFGLSTGNPSLVNKGICDQYGGYWDTIGLTNTNTSTTTTTTVGTAVSGVGIVGTQATPLPTLRRVGKETPVGTINLNTFVITQTPSTSSNGNCMCKPIVDQCVIDITEVQIINTLDLFNNTIQIVTKNGTPISEACCNRLIKDNNLPWVWQSPYCYSVPKDDCLPVTFSLNDTTMDVPPCENDLEISMWVYFGKPENPCQPIPDPPSDDSITIDGVFCDITLTPNTGAVIPVLNGNVTLPNPSSSNARQVGTETPAGTIDLTTFVITQAADTKPCCYNITNPILAKVSLTDPTLNSLLTQVKVYNSSTDYFDRWVEVKATLPSSGLTLNFGVKLEIYQGLACCCNYDIFVDDIRVNCAKQESSLVVNDIHCPGFNLTRVIDNKKSWAYNPGIPSVGISDYDNIERNDGSFGMLNGEGTINRTFAPSLDADIPWRYTDYFKQSSVYEKHSNLVLNSKELWLTFDMCADCPISGTTLACPSGHTLSANTSICYQTNCMSYNITNTGGDCSLDYTDCNSNVITPIIVSANTSIDVCSTVPPSTVFACTGLVITSTTVCSSSIVSATTVTTLTYLSLYDLKNYKKQFQSFWIPFMEQFIPATTIWVAGERWCSEACTIISPCDYDFELVDSEITVEAVPTGFFPTTGSTTGTISSPVLTGRTSTTILGTSSATLVTDTPLITPVVDLGLTRTTTMVLSQLEASINMTAYQNNFMTPIKQILL